MSISNEGDSISPSTSCTTDVINQLVETIQDNRQTINNLKSQISDVRDELATRAKRNAKHRKRISEQEEQISEQKDRISELEDKTGYTDGSQSSEKQPSTDEGDEDGSDGDSTATALEQVCALPEETVMNSLSANQKRARSVARRIKDYGKSVPAGIAITSTRIRDILSGLEDKRVHRQTVQRVADFLKRFGDGHIDTKETRGGKDVVVFSDSVVESITSVVTGNKDPGVTPAII